MKFYQHTINGKPGEFNGQQIVYSSGGKGKRYPICKDLKQIRKQQNATADFRIKRGYDYHSSDYNYVIIEVSDIQHSQGGK